MAGLFNRDLHRIAAVLLVLLLAFASGCGQATETSPPLGKEPPEPATAAIHYWLQVSVDVARSTEDETIVLGGGPIGGLVTIWVNDCPLLLHASGGIMFPVTAWVLAGSNQIRVEGKYTSPLIVAVYTSDSGEMKGLGQFVAREVLAKEKLAPHEAEHEISFEASTGYALARTELPKGEERMRIEQELSAVLSKLETSLKKHDVEAIVAVLNPSQAPPGLAANVAGNAEQLEEARRKNRELFSDASLSIEGRAQDLKILWGKRCVLAYAGVVGDTFPEPFSFQLRSSDASGQLPPLRFIRVGERWVVF